MADDVVYRVTEAMYVNEAEFRASSPIWSTHRSTNTAQRQPGPPYHVAAVKSYKDVGLWKGGT